VNGLHVAFTFWFPNNNTEVISAPGAGSGKVYSHDFRLTLGAEAIQLVVNSGEKSATWSYFVIRKFFVMPQTIVLFVVRKLLSISAALKTLRNTNYENEWPRERVYELRITNKKTRT
jgi:hypothetical protein